MSGKKICCKTVHLSYEENELLEAIAHAEGKSCSQVLHEFMTAGMGDHRERFNKMAEVLGWAPRSGRSEGKPQVERSANLVYQDGERPNYSRMH